MIFQDPMTSLNPVKKIGWQLEEAVLVHRDVSHKEARALALEAMKSVRIPRAEQRIDDYPHQFSGGMRQRVMIAMALINEPELVIADEPTTALDVTTQAQILELMNELQQERGMAIIMITHDLGVVAEIADDVIVMYGGQVVGARAGRRDLLPPAAPLHVGPARLAAAPRPRGRAAGADPRAAAVAAQPPVGLSLPPALRLRDGRLPHARCRSSSRSARTRTCSGAGSTTRRKERESARTIASLQQEAS